MINIYNMVSKLNILHAQIMCTSFYYKISDKQVLFYHLSSSYLHLFTFLTACDVKNSLKKIGSHSDAAPCWNI